MSCNKLDARRQFSPNQTATQINPTFSRADLVASLSDTNIAKVLPDFNNTSKAIDENGESALTFHATTKDIAAFDETRAGVEVSR